ncbi:unnamed protein product, partial [Auanema sp. JU1783]
QEVPEFMLEMEKSFVEAGISRTFGQPSFGRTEFGQQSNTNAWDLTTTSAEDTEVSASAAPNSSIPSSGDPWASSSGWGESTQKFKFFILDDEPTIEDNDANVNEEGESYLCKVPLVAERSAKSEDISELSRQDNLKSAVTFPLNTRDNSFGTFDDWDTSGAVWGSGIDDYYQPLLILHDCVA